MAGKRQTTLPVGSVILRSSIQPARIIISSKETYDWQKDLVRSNAIDNQYDLKLSGGTDKIDYYTSVGYRNQQSNFVGGGFEQYTGAINLNAQAKKWLKTWCKLQIFTAEN